ncbi:protein translocase subunit SecF [Helicobacter saguini]|uniref:Protein-export membrane protein SecF n=1 Tax=Helicobacter saguini TaxID=1548018 RepID=A0A347VPT2_9HELI|nr:protein translocase subunit SecF [Helicobacter saguini]MWV61226.1 protein translocase subunit SecF [Helicobacter saguini]MWV68107.1 protein translocase subunit SecF [Helicobacter saguini]MWV70429.1 protein translocase subunit SecF [Helicobacter saguini]MWV72330.1 protein translocase subunit SecF [Helicobacter saguini]TLD92982.1 protein translocase subunit SecF [Helicobacter saguini]
MEIFKKSKIYDFVGWSKWGLALSVLLTIGAFYLFFGVGFNLGIDFAGGSAAQIQYVGDAKSGVTNTQNMESNSQDSINSQPSLEQIRTLLSTNAIFTNAQVSNFGDEILIKIPYQEGVTNEQIENALHSTLDSSGHFEIRKLDSISAKVGDELARSAVISLILATIAMMIYVSFRYEWRFALASIITLVHDIIITAASVIVFKIDLNLEVIAALLALLGYSINDTIIIFDRIREKMLEGKKMSIEEVINEAISNTLPRTLLTSLTMFFAVLTLYIFGGHNIIGFSLPLLVGVVFGTYSSMFVAPKLAILLGFSIEKYYAKEVAKAKKVEERRRQRQLYEGGRV